MTVSLEANLPIRKYTAEKKTHSKRDSLKLMSAALFGRNNKKLGEKDRMATYWEKYQSVSNLGSHLKYIGTFSPPFRWGKF